MRLQSVCERAMGGWESTATDRKVEIEMALECCLLYLASDGSSGGQAGSLIE